jgi:drug/metabolite transporter (DMT)-like permease
MWVFLALGSALSLSFSDVLAKRALRTADPVGVAWIKFAGASIFAFPFLIQAATPAPWPFVGYLAMAVPLEALAIYGYHVAIARSPLSLTLPMLAFTPVFLLGVAFLLLDEIPTLQGYGGVFLVTLGAYLLHLTPGMRWDGPLRAIWREPGARIMLGVAMLYSLTASLGKKLMLLSSPAFFGAFYPVILALFFSPSLLRAERRRTVGALPWVWIGLLGLTYGLMVMLHFMALSRAPVAYMISVKRTSLLFAVLWGRLFFGEQATSRRLFAALVMLGGVVLLSL